MRGLVRRRGIAIVALFAGSTMTVTGAPEWASETAKDFLAYPSAERELRELRTQREDFQAEINHVIRRCGIKDMILDDLESDRITLLDAAKRFQEMDRGSRIIAGLLYPPERVGSFDEIAAMTVINHMRARRGAAQLRETDTVARLEREFETVYGYRPE
jgi:hypothetical protein